MTLPRTLETVYRGSSVTIEYRLSDEEPNGVMIMRVITDDDTVLPFDIHEGIEDENLEALLENEYADSEDD